MKYLCKLCLILLVITNLDSFGQSKTTSIQQKKQYQYSFEGQLNSQSISSLENRLAALPFATGAKVKYKADSNKGEIFIFTSEKIITSEGEKGFDLIELKKLLISNNLTPLELSSITLN